MKFNINNKLFLFINFIMIIIFIINNTFNKIIITNEYLFTYFYIYLNIANSLLFLKISIYFLKKFYIIFKK